ncbi:DUF4357 domain-containing protein [Halodesulfovibrio aestuarii]|uniref:DUF4357 domain-containing protein n=1 Tax=Halodesulfovibrio aestuarii TaxID=126333 RepID=UPI0003F533BB
MACNRFLIFQNNQLTTTKHILFPSPSSAAEFVTGASENGWGLWTAIQAGQVIDAYIEQGVEIAP